MYGRLDTSWVAAALYMVMAGRGGAVNRRQQQSGIRAVSKRCNSATVSNIGVAVDRSQSVVGAVVVSCVASIWCASPVRRNREGTTADPPDITGPCSQLAPFPSPVLTDTDHLHQPHNPHPRRVV
jgi:hypothetical protein